MDPSLVGISLVPSFGSLEFTKDIAVNSNRYLDHPSTTTRCCRHACSSLLERGLDDPFSSFMRRRCFPWTGSVQPNVIRFLKVGLDKIIFIYCTLSPSYSQVYSSAIAQAPSNFSPVRCCFPTRILAVACCKRSFYVRCDVYGILWTGFPQLTCPFSGT